MNVNDLPCEILCSIFDELDLRELKIASLVCRRWSDLTFSGRRMDRVWLVKRNSSCEFFINSKRNYRNVRQPSWTMATIDDQHKSLVRLLHTLKPHVRMVEIQTRICSQQLLSILLEIPTLQHLSIAGGIDHEYRKDNATVRVLAELKSPNGRQLFSFCRTNFRNLQFLNMNCMKDVELEAWKILSGQLKLAHVKSLRETYLHSLLELSFPFVEDFTLVLFYLPFYFGDQGMTSGLGAAFFRRHPLLRRLSLSGMIISVQWVESISQHCPELTHLELALNDQNEGFLEPLVQLRKLKHLSLAGPVDSKVLRGVMTSLKSVELKMNPPHMLLENLCEVVPQLSCLQVKERIPYVEIQFICERFSCLRRLVLDYDCRSSPADDSVRLDRLVHLQELEMSDTIRVCWIHRNNVRCLTITRFREPVPDLEIITHPNNGRFLISPSPDISFPTITDDDLMQIPTKFPVLKILILNCDVYSLSVAAVERLHQLMPSCRIEYGNKRFYPTMTAD
ncbi:uncharacterized protein LOC131216531 [Anopheles bellator]|uniref:uncharacterized protein LOC131216531 n=1 Tax=Anopheles bellator TaxID=139047 RepID=UPI0026482AD2|nr:uncharacterized protein LOC131216531 [Anopheles bellator]